MKRYLPLLSLVIVLILCFTKYANIMEMEENGTADSFADISALLYVVAGALLVFIAYVTVGLKIGNPLAIIPYGIGISLFIYGLYICSLKGIW